MVEIVAFGDSITFGCGDTGVSQGRRSDEQGFLPILSAALTTQRGQVHHLINAGHPGETSAQGVQRLPGLLTSYPDAMTYLLLFGMNDARPWEPVPSGLGLYGGEAGYAGSYKANLEQMITMIHEAGKKVGLAKIPIALGRQAGLGRYDVPDRGERSLHIKTYNRVIDELIADPSHHIDIRSPDLYSYFKVHAVDEYADNVHPDHTGYRSIAAAWSDVLQGVVL